MMTFSVRYISREIRTQKIVSPRRLRRTTPCITYTTDHLHGRNLIFFKWIIAFTRHNIVVLHSNDAVTSLYRT